MKSDKKYCPFAQVSLACNEKCPVYDKKTKMCSFKSIAESLVAIIRVLSARF